MLAQRQITTLYIDPGCPWQNGKDERFNGTVRDECLNMQLFVSVREARIRVEAFRRHYNEARPHSRLGYQCQGRIEIPQNGRGGIPQLICTTLYASWSVRSLVASFPVGGRS
jgi:transposase InsO family protein